MFKMVKDIVKILDISWRFGGMNLTSKEIISKILMH